MIIPDMIIIRFPYRYSPEYPWVVDLDTCTPCYLTDDCDDCLLSIVEDRIRYIGFSSRLKYGRPVNVHAGAVILDNEIPVDG